MEARQNYRRHNDSKYFCSKNVCYSVDLQKVIMLPRMDGIKKVIFTKRIISFNESFVPMGENQKHLKPNEVI